MKKQKYITMPDGNVYIKIFIPGINGHVLEDYYYNINTGEKHHNDSFRQQQYNRYSPHAVKPAQSYYWTIKEVGTVSHELLEECSKTAKSKIKIKKYDKKTNN